MKPCPVVNGVRLHPLMMTEWQEMLCEDLEQSPVGKPRPHPADELQPNMQLEFSTQL